MSSSQLTNIFRRGWNHQPEKNWIYATLGILLSRSMMEKKNGKLKIEPKRSLTRNPKQQRWRCYKHLQNPPKLETLQGGAPPSYVCWFINHSKYMSIYRHQKPEWNWSELFTNFFAIPNWGTLYKLKMQARITLEAGPGAQGTGGTTDQLGV